SIVRPGNSGASRESDVRTSGPRPGLWLTIMTVRNRQEIVEDGPRSIDARRTRTRQCSFGYGRSPASTRRWPHDPVTRTPADVPFMAVPGCVRRIHFGREGPMTLRTRTRHVRSVIPAIALSLAAMFAPLSASADTDLVLGGSAVVAWANGDNVNVRA